jgi:anti-sigma factor RsiW
MDCESCKAKLDTYLDGELAEEEMRTFDTHVRGCLSCASEALARTQLRRSIKAAGHAFTPSVEFRKRLQQSVAARPRPGLGFAGSPSGWMLATAAAVLVAFVFMITTYLSSRSSSEHVLSEVADLHVSALASSSPVDVVSTDRHTVKPWFQGKIPFAFTLPELQSTEFSLLGGRMSYLDQAPGAQLIYDAGKHHISVFVFQERAVPESLRRTSLDQKKLPFNMETWSQDGLRYFVIGDASAEDIERLSKLFKG